MRDVCDTQPSMEPESCVLLSANPRRVISVLLGCIIPILGLYVLGHSIVVLSVVLFVHLVGIFVERWLFFAEAKHVVATYYTDITDETSLHGWTETARQSRF